mgnify:CR=1 FL=1
MKTHTIASCTFIHSLLTITCIANSGCGSGELNSQQRPNSIDTRRLQLIGDWSISHPDDERATGSMSLLSDGTCSIDVHTGSWGILVPQRIVVAGKWQLLDIETIKFEWQKSSTGSELQGLIETWKIMAIDDSTLRLRKSTLSADRSGIVAWERIK